MPSYVLVIALTAFLAGVASALFMVAVIGIRHGACLRRPPAAPGGALDAFTRAGLASGSWPTSREAAYDDPRAPQSPRA